MNASQLERQAARYWFRSLVGLIALVLLAPLAIRDSNRALIGMFNFPASWLPQSMAVRSEYDQFRRLFRGDEIVMIGWEGAVVGAPELDAAKAVLTPYTRATDERPAYLDEVLTGDDVIEQLTSPPTSFSERSALVRLRGVVLGDQGEQTVLFASYTPAGARARRTSLSVFREAVADAIDRPAEEVYMVGPPVDGAIVDEEAYRSIQRFTLPSFLLGAIICVLCLRSLALTAAVLSVALVGQGLSLAAVHWTGLDMNAILIVLPPLVFVLTASAGIHLSNYFLDGIRSDPRIDPVEAARQAMRAGTAPCWLAASTTIVGLGSLGLVRLWPVSAFGLIAAAAVFTTLILLMLLLPGAMVWQGRRMRARQAAVRTRQAKASAASESKSSPRLADDRDRDTRSGGDERRGIFATLRDKLLDHPVPVVAVFVVVTLTCGFGLPRLETSVNLPRMFPPESRIRTDYEWFEERIGPTSNAEAIIAFTPEALPDPLDRFELVRQLDNEIRQIESVGGVISPRTFLPTPPPPNRRSIRATAVKANIRTQIEDADSALSQSGYLATNERGEQLWRIGFRFPFDETIDYRESLRNVQSLLAPIIQQAIVEEGLRGSDIRIAYTGGVPLTTTSQDVLLRDLFRSFLSAFAIVGLMMIVVLRSVAGGMLAMFPNLFPTITLFGFMGLASMPLDIGSVMTASVALGIAVDGTVHLLSRFRRHLRDHADRREAVVTALAHCGPAMWQTTAVCALSPLVYGLSEFLPTQRFALMMFGLLFAALVGDVVLLPALLASPLGRFLRPPRRQRARAGRSSDEASGATSAGYQIAARRRQQAAASKRR